MSELNELYQELIIDHSKRPRNFHRLEDPKRTAQGYNPLCGDKITLDVKLENNHIGDIGFQGSGCAISTASASLMTESVKGKTLQEADVLFDKFHSLITNDKADASGMGKLAVFSGVREFPARAKCATLAWHTLRAALQERDTPVSTE
ncbi:MAG TPA: SUF system NifU family Fe-S cluster assembly protein [Bryobacteraceae bacterium]|jgi:nitrogen fixation NifU-like protein